LGELIRIVFSVFALYRLASLISSDEGPYLPFLYKDEDQIGVFKWLRKKLGGEDLAYDEHGDLKPRTNLGRGVICPLCTAAYLAVPVIVLLQFPTILGNLFLAWLGIWGVQTFLENLTSDDAIKGAIEDVAESMDA
jgi:hypothetical protein